MHRKKSLLTFIFSVFGMIVPIEGYQYFKHVSEIDEIAIEFENNFVLSETYQCVCQSMPSGGLQVYAIILSKHYQFTTILSVLNSIYNIGKSLFSRMQIWRQIENKIQSLINLSSIGNEYDHDRNKNRDNYNVEVTSEDAAKYFGGDAKYISKSDNQFIDSSSYMPRVVDIETLKQLKLSQMKQNENENENDTGEENLNVDHDVKLILLKNYGKCFGRFVGLYFSFDFVLRCVGTALLSTLIDVHIRIANFQVNILWIVVPCIFVIEILIPLAYYTCIRGITQKNTSIMNNNKTQTKTKDYCIGVVIPLIVKCLFWGISGLVTSFILFMDIINDCDNETIWTRAILFYIIDYSVRLLVSFVCLVLMVLQTQNDMDDGTLQVWFAVLLLAVIVTIIGNILMLFDQHKVKHTVKENSMILLNQTNSTKSNAGVNNVEMRNVDIEAVVDNQVLKILNQLLLKVPLVT